ncbi:hypothetical protein FB451DRAFT_1521093 [Mycena latifolia]|nr:hypothetical protein FB451DRAFT_1521093 [Mycena latifolia]
MATGIHAGEYAAAASHARHRAQDAARRIPPPASPLLEILAPGVKWAVAVRHVPPPPGTPVRRDVARACHPSRPLGPTLPAEALARSTSYSATSSASESTWGGEGHQLSFSNITQQDQLTGFPALRQRQDHTHVKLRRGQEATGTHCMPRMQESPASAQGIVHTRLAVLNPPCAPLRADNMPPARTSRRCVCADSEDSPHAARAEAPQSLRGLSCTLERASRAARAGTPANAWAIMRVRLAGI